MSQFEIILIPFQQNFLVEKRKENEIKDQERKRKIPKKYKNFDSEKNLIKSLLEKYARMEQQAALLSAKIVYYYPTEYDSNLTEFEKAANNENICVSSRLEAKYASQIISLFRALYDNNFWTFDPESLDITEEESKELGYDPEKWFLLAEKSKETLKINKAGEQYFENIRVSEKRKPFAWPFTAEHLLTYF